MRARSVSEAVERISEGASLMIGDAQRMARPWSHDNSTGITIRAVRPDDRERIVNAFLALDAESIRQRFFVPKKALSDKELRRLIESDGVRDVVLVATTASADQ